MKTKAIIILFSMFLLGSCTKKMLPAKRYAIEHSDKNFESALKSNKSFRLISAKENLKEAKKKARESKKGNKEQEKIQKILSEIQTIKNNK